MEQLADRINHSDNYSCTVELGPWKMRKKLPKLNSMIGSIWNFTSFFYSFQCFGSVCEWMNESTSHFSWYNIFDKSVHKWCGRLFSISIYIHINGTCGLTLTFSFLINQLSDSGGASGWRRGENVSLLQFGAALNKGTHHNQREKNHIV